MQTLLRSEISRTLDMKKLRSILPNYVKVATYDSLLKVKTLKAAMGHHTVLILLFNIHNKKHNSTKKCMQFESTPDIFEWFESEKL